MALTKYIHTVPNCFQVSLRLYRRCSASRSSCSCFAAFWFKGCGGQSQAETAQSTATSCRLWTTEGVAITASSWNSGQSCHQSESGNWISFILGLAEMHSAWLRCGDTFAVRCQHNGHNYAKKMAEMLDWLILVNWKATAILKARKLMFLHITVLTRIPYITSQTSILCRKCTM